MDIARPDQARKLRRRRILYGIASFLTFALISFGVSRLKPALPLVENAYTDTVKRREMPLQVRGNGTLVPELIRWIPALNAGRIENILVFAGAAVQADTVLIELSNPEVEQSAFEDEWLLKAAEAELANLEVQLDSQLLTQEAVARTAMASYNKAKLKPK